MSPLAKKLLMKPRQTWLILNAVPGYLALLEPLPDGIHLQFDATDTVNGIQLFVKTAAELGDILAHLKSLLKSDTILWVIYPKKNSGIESDLEMMSGWEAAKQYGLRPVASAAIDNTWTTLRFRPENLVKHSDFSQESIKKNDYSAFIDTDNKQITLPPDVADALGNTPATLSIYSNLAWSHRKEYMVWILSAKQEQTRAGRISKMIDMLLAGKKNPSEK
ncbi:YdeI/OmpD-associated family protein [Mucilaginibacter glaciei]|uniref:YdeI/OmpD-associated family protein n=1 Tax=Mucilaginibacter glaciei TaxID=2772109 RepID=A0A926NZV6_9SPHI|nr:YdeI/OmpD-associated family protein [Mucilaginibacter glaciei]MBD1395008.1 YdeI/OmpD-associated family protein [Mucilaginibacter glaciei]